MPRTLTSRSWVSVCVCVLPAVWPVLLHGCVSLLLSRPHSQHAHSHVLRPAADSTCCCGLGVAAAGIRMASVGLMVQGRISEFDLIYYPHVDKSKRELRFFARDNINESIVYLLHSKGRS